MADNYEKLWLQSNLNQLAQKRAALAIEQTGSALPCRVTAVTGSIVTVEFEVEGGSWQLLPLTLPKAESQWLRAPTQIGDFGMTVPADVSVAGISGLGTGIADLSVSYGNQSTLVWVPVAATTFSAAPDPNKAWVNGPNGAVVSDSAQQNTITVDLDPSITQTVQITVSGTVQKLQSIIDGTANSISHVVPSGGLIGLGALASSLGATRAAAAQNDLEQLATGPAGIVNQTLVSLAAAIGSAIGSSSSTWSTAQTQLKTIFEAASFISGISGINPTIPSCSSITRIAP